MSDQRTNVGVARSTDANLDPITGEPGAHPVGVGAGAIGAGAVAGAVGGVLGGPIGVVAGAAIGAVVGGFAGKAAAEGINPTSEIAYWQKTHNSRPYFQSAYGYDDYGPAYRYGWENYDRRARIGQTFEQAEQELSDGWSDFRGTSKLEWKEAKSATRDAWDRVASRMRSQNP